MAAKTKIHNIRDIFPNCNLLEGATIAQGEDGIFKVFGFTIIKSGLSMNKNYYSEKVLAESARDGIFNNKQIRTDHPDIAGGQASVKDVVGKITKTWYDGNKKSLRGDGFFSATVPDLVTKVKEGLVGDLSINARGVTEMVRDDDKLRRHVKKITEGFSVDLVCEAAAGGTLHEEYLRHKRFCESMRYKMDELEKLTLEELKEARSDLVAKIEEEVKTKLLKESKEDKSTITKEDVQTVVTEAITNALKTRDTEDAKRRDAQVLTESIEAAIEDVMNESNVKDSIKSFVKRNLIPFGTKTFTKVGEIDKKKLSEERDRVISDFTNLIKDFKEQPPAPTGGNGSSERSTHLVDLLV